MNLIYGIKDKPKFAQMLLFAFQQVLAILAATILVPAIIGNGMSQSAALFGAGVGTIVYLLFTKFRSPVFLGSSFAFLGSMFAAFGGAASMAADHYVVQAEGIYTGYKYYESRYYDSVVGQGNASSPVGAYESKGNWNYADEVTYGFGFGDS